MNVAVCPSGFHVCQSGECIARRLVVLCDGIRQCSDGSDEEECFKTMPHALGGYEPPQSVAATIVLPTIVACIVLVISMVVGIKKCHKWEADRIVELRRSRRAIQSRTAILKAKNIQRLQAALTIQGGDDLVANGTGGGCPPPRYCRGSTSSSSSFSVAVGHSPPPSYSSSVLNRLMGELRGTDIGRDLFPSGGHNRSKQLRLSFAGQKDSPSSSLNWV